MPNYTEMALELQVELEQITHAQEKLRKRAEGVINALNAISVLAQESGEPLVEPPPLSPDEERGFTGQVRAILSANPIRAFTAVDIRNVILERLDSDDESDPKVMLIHAHNTLKRLFKQDEVLQVPMPDGRTGYKWKSTRGVVDLMAALKESLGKLEKQGFGRSVISSDAPIPTAEETAAAMAENDKRLKSHMEKRAAREREEILEHAAAMRRNRQKKEG